MAADNRPVRIGLVGFGVGGNYFHAPFIEAARGVELAGVVARSRTPAKHSPLASPQSLPTTPSPR